jgi:hypothetical protein
MELMIEARTKLAEACSFAPEVSIYNVGGVGGTGLPWVRGGGFVVLFW